MKRSLFGVTAKKDKEKPFGFVVTSDSTAGAIARGLLIHRELVAIDAVELGEKGKEETAEKHHRWSMGIVSAGGSVVGEF